MAQRVTNTVTIVQSSNIPEFNPENESWILWKEKLDVHFFEMKCTDLDAKKAILLKSIGSEPYKLLHSLCSPKSPVNKTYDEICEIMNMHFTPPTIIFRERKKFYTAKISENETISDWYAKTKNLALNCKFGEHLNSFILDRFIVGLPENIFEKFFEEDETLALEKALQKALILETKVKNDKTNYKNSHVNIIHRHQGGAKKYRNNAKLNNSYNSGNFKRESNKHSNYTETTTNQSIKCKHCGWKNRTSKECRYKNSKCNKCKKIGHLASICYGNFRKTVNYVSNDSNTNDINTNENILSIFSVLNNNSKDWYHVSIIMNGISMNIACDTGASCTIIPYSLFERFDDNLILRPCKNSYYDYGGNKIKIIGEFDCAIEYNGKLKFITTIVTNTRFFEKI